MRLFLAACAALLFTLPALADDKDKKKEKLLSPQFEKALLADVLTWLTKEAGYEYTFSPAAQKVARRGLIEVNLVGEELRPWEALQQVLASVELACVRKTAGQVRILTVEEFTRDIVLELYDVRDLLVPVNDFEGPEVAWGDVSKEENPGAHFADEGDEEKKKAPKPIEDPEKLPALVRDGTGGDETWTEDMKITLSNGVLYVRAPQALHTKIRAFLNSLRQYK